MNREPDEEAFRRLQGWADDRVNGLGSHDWQWDESSSGVAFEYCCRCHRDKADCRANEFHGDIPCDNGAWMHRGN